MNIKRIIKNIIPQDIYMICNLIKLNLRKLYFHNGKNINRMQKFVQRQYSKNRKATKKIDFENPQTYTEKLCKSKIHDVTKEKIELADKLQVRTYIEQKIGEQYLVPLIGVYDSFDEIDFNSLPRDFVIKCTHDSGSTTIVKNGNYDIKKLKKKYKYYLKRPFAFLSCEMHYNKIKPRIIVEQLLCDGENNEINDYKFLCFDGKVCFCWVDFDRYTNHKRNIYNLDWELQEFNQHTFGNYLGNIEKPKGFEKMVQLAEILCQGFPHVRVDFYNIEGEIFFGELTFSNGGGNDVIVPEKWDYFLGDLWKDKK